MSGVTLHETESPKTNFWELSEQIFTGQTPQQLANHHRQQNYKKTLSSLNKLAGWNVTIELEKPIKLQPLLP